MRLICIVSDKDNLCNPDTYRLLGIAAQDKNIEFVTIESAKADVGAMSDFEIKRGDLLYRLGIDHDSTFAEALLLRNGIANLYRVNDGLFARAFNWGSVIKMNNAGINIIPTHFSVSNDEQVLLKNVEVVGGFPVVLKSSGGSHGSGVKLANSLVELREAAMDLRAKNPAGRLVLRKFISNARHIRCVVIDDKVVDAIEYLPVANDFRTNAINEPLVKPFIYDDAVFKLAENAVKTQLTEFGGVDILVDERGDAYVAEINFPCNFARNQMCTGVNIAGMIIDRLIDKAKR